MTCDARCDRPMGSITFVVNEVELIPMVSLVSHPRCFHSMRSGCGADPSKPPGGNGDHPPSAWSISILHGRLESVRSLERICASQDDGWQRAIGVPRGPGRSRLLQYTSPMIARTRCLPGVVGDDADDEMHAPVVALPEGL